MSTNALIEKIEATLLFLENTILETSKSSARIIEEKTAELTALMGELGKLSPEEKKPLLDKMIGISARMEALSGKMFNITQAEKGKMENLNQGIKIQKAYKSYGDD